MKEFEQLRQDKTAAKEQKIGKQRMVSTRPATECSSPPRAQILNREITLQKCPGAPRKRKKPSSYYYTPATQDDSSDAWPTRRLFQDGDVPMSTIREMSTLSSRFRPSVQIFDENNSTQESRNSQEEQRH